jgi:N-acylneuraminate cytidylyltransferase
LIAFIPARMGSKRLPNKNIKEFFGKPIINYTIQAALDSKLFDKILISTDIISLVKSAINIIDNRIEVVERSEDLSKDSVILYDTLIDYLNKVQYKEKYVCLLYPCAPFIKAQHLIEGYKELQKGYDTVFPITKSNIKVQQLLQKVDCKKYRFIKSDNKKYIGKKVLCKNVVMLHPDFNNTNSNEWPETYIHAGQWFWCDVEKLYKNKTLVPVNSGYIELPWNEVQDIDTIEDWQLAKFKYKFNKDNESRI